MISGVTPFVAKEIEVPASFLTGIGAKSYQLQVLVSGTQIGSKVDTDGLRSNYVKKHRCLTAVGGGVQGNKLSAIKDDDPRAYLNVRDAGDKPLWRPGECERCRGGTSGEGGFECLILAAYQVMVAKQGLVE